MFANLFSFLQILARYVESVITLSQISGTLLRLPLFCPVFLARSLQSEHAGETSLTTYCVHLCFQLRIFMLRALLRSMKQIYTLYIRFYLHCIYTYFVKVKNTSFSLCVVVAIRLLLLLFLFLHTNHIKSRER